MPLIRLKDEYLEQEDGVRFLMADELGNTVACKVSHEALRAQAERVHFSGTDGAVFQAYRELIEELASDAFDGRGHSIIMAACLLPLKRWRGSCAAPSRSYQGAHGPGRRASICCVDRVWEAPRHANVEAVSR